VDTLTELLLIAVVLGAVIVYLSSMAGRLDRLHHRIESTHAALDAQLLRRGAAANELAISGFLDPASAFAVSGATQDALLVDPDDDGVADQLLAELAEGCRRVELSRRFHNDVVRSTLQLRRKRVVRWFRLAGYTPLPTTADFDDTVPPGLSDL
jgi:hypothetical protein